MKWFFIALAVAVAIFRVVLLNFSFNEHIETSYQALAHGLVFGLLGWWLREDKEEFESFGAVVSTLYAIFMILFSPIMFMYEDFDPPKVILKENWPIFVVTGLTWVEIICATVSIL